MSKTKRNVRKNKLSKTKKNSLDKQRIVFERFEEDYEKSIKEGMKKKNKKFLSKNFN